MDNFIEILKSIFFGIVEGVTEWLPVSSTGHLIITNEFFKLEVSKPFWELFCVVIQLGAIAAVPILFFGKLNPFSKTKTANERKMTWSLWFKVFVGVAPAAIVGFLLDDFFEKHLYNYIVVAMALAVYGVAFILIEKFKRSRTYRVESVYDISYTDALAIGAFQMLSLVPGTSRSGSTILGGMLIGVSRVASAEFSFFMAIPVMIGASLLKVAKFFMTDENVISGFEFLLLGIAMLVSFIVSLIAIKFLMNFVKRHSFTSFGIYRIALAVFVLGFFMIAR